MDEPFGVDLSETVYALDATTIDLCLSVFPWAPFRSTKAAIKLHTLLDLRGNIPSFIHISDGKLHDVNILDQIIPEAGAFYIMDRGYLDFTRLHRLHQAGSFFVTRAKANLRFTRRYSQPTDRTSGIICDQLGTLTGFYSQQHFPTTIRRIKIRDAEGKTLVFLTNHLDLSAQSIADLYRCRWQIELFFKWIKQHLRIKSFFGTSENAVKSQIWIAVSVYVLVASLLASALKISRNFEHAFVSLRDCIEFSEPVCVRLRLAWRKNLYKEARELLAYIYVLPKGARQQCLSLPFNKGRVRTCSTTAWHKAPSKKFLLCSMYVWCSPFSPPSTIGSPRAVLGIQSMPVVLGGILKKFLPKFFVLAGITDKGCLSRI